MTAEHAARPEELVRASERLLAAIVTRDAPVLEEMLDPDFAHFDATGAKTERREFIEQVLGSTFTVLHAAFESLAVDIVGGFAVVNGVQRAEVALGPGERVVSRGAFTDVFVPSDRGWRIRIARSVELDA